MSYVAGVIMANSTVSYNYDFRILDTEYEFGEKVLSADVDEELELNSTIEITVDVVAIGSKIVSVGTVTPS